MPDERTPALNLPLPHPDHMLSEDVLRLREAFTTLDAGFGTQRSEVQAALSQTRSEVQAALADAVAAEAAARQQAIAQATAQPSSAEYAYDANGRVATIHEALPGGVRATTIQYDAHGRVSSVVAEHGGVTRTTSYTYDDSGAVIWFDVTEERNV